MEFEYLLDKINEATILMDPFEHVVIDNFFNEEHFNLFLRDNQIHPQKALNNENLRKILSAENYHVINFPGCTISEDEYFSSLNSEKQIVKNNCHYDSELNKTLEGFGITYKLGKIRNKKIEEIILFMRSQKFKDCLKKKFAIEKCNIKIEIQKNLTNYEISPHPDIRQKALTFLLNINSDSFGTIPTENFNTHLLEFKDEKKFIKDFWRQNPKFQRCWVPWEWCETKKIISTNNSLLMFKPSESSLHAVRLKYDHLETQRTQIYGNLMFSNVGSFKNMSFEDFEK